MKFRVLMMVALLMICIIIGIIFIKGSSNLYLIQENIISYIEENYQVEIKFEEISLWPLNQITLEGLEFFSRDSALSLSAARVQINYNFLNIFTREPDFENLINNVEMDRPSLIIKNMEIKDEGISTAFPITTPFQLTVNKGTIHYSDGQNRVSLPEISLVYQKINRKESRLMVNSGLNLRHLDINDFTLEDINLNNLELNLLVLDRQWQARLESDYLNLNKLLTVVSQLENLPPFFKEPEGRAKIDLDLAGQGFSINEYKGYLTLRELSSKINIPQVIEEAELRGMEGEILFSSQNDSFYLQNCSFTLEEIPYHFTGSLGFNEGEPELLSARLVSEEFEPSLFFTTLQEKANSKLPDFSPLIELKGKGFLEIRAGGTLPEAGYSLEFHLNDGYYADNKLHNFQLALNHYQDYLYLDTLDILMDEGAFISARGLYNTRTTDYNLALNTSKLDLDILKTISEIEGFPLSQKENFSLDEIQGIINLNSTISGCGKESSELYISGQLELRSPKIGDFQLTRLESSFRVTGTQLFIYDGLLASTAGILDFSGGIGLKDESLKLEILGDELLLQSLLSELQPLLSEVISGEVYNELSGNINIRGEVLGTISKPEFDLRAEMPGGSIRGREIKELSLNLCYVEEEIIVDRLNLSAENLVLSGNGGMSLRSDNTHIYSDIRVDTSCEFLTEITGQELPLEGELEGEISINGSPEFLVIEGEIKPVNSRLLALDRELKLEDALLSFRWNKDTLLLQNITAHMDDARLEGYGSITDGLLELDFALDGLNAEQLIPEAEIAGTLELQGSITGRLS
ncbi:MAG TPA: hypothetical protein VKY40_07105, partial [Halanaerobiales bacterium]|nr:hypothetical protein [Halanaerobiales bacterium]